MYAGGSSKTDALENFLASTFDAGSFELDSLTVMNCQLRPHSVESDTLSRKDMFAHLGAGELIEGAGPRGVNRASERHTRVYIDS